MSILRTIHATSAAMRQAAVRAPMATAALARSSSNAHTGVAASAAPAFAFAARPLVLRRCMGHKPPKHSSKITGHELTKALGTLDGWTKLLERDCIVKKYEFADFNECWAVMSRVALLAEKVNHHPKWLNVYGHLRVELETHDVNGLSEMDIYMAQMIDTYVAAIRKPTIPGL